MVGEGLRVVGLGIAIGLVGALALGRLLSASLYQISAADPVTLASAALSLVVVATLACYLPARRAARVNPIVALRYE